MSDFVTHLRTLVDAESPSADPAAVTAAQDVLDELGSQLLGVRPVRHRDVLSLEWRLGDPDDDRRVLLLGHLDTVWPLGTLARRPLDVADGRVTGPGIFDMKAGVVVGLHVLAELGKEVPVSLLVTGDEEIGSVTSRSLIERAAHGSQACLVLEGARPDGAVKSARRGWSFYTVEFHGVAAHAGLEPDNGVNVLPALADAVVQVGRIRAEFPGATLNPTTARAGTTSNTIPDHGAVTVDVRCSTADQQRAVDDAMRQLVDGLAGDVRVDLHGGANRPPMQAGADHGLVDRLRSTQRRLGFGESGDVSVGGISDANLTAAIGVPTLDGLGAVGGGPHAEHEWIDLVRTRERVPTLAALVRDLLDNPLPTRDMAEDT